MPVLRPRAAAFFYEVSSMSHLIHPAAMSPIKYTNEHNNEVWRNVMGCTPMVLLSFHECDNNLPGDRQWALFTDLGNITVVDRMTGFGWRDVETGYRDMSGKFWLASGGYDARKCGLETFAEVVEWVKLNANTCVGI